MMTLDFIVAVLLCSQKWAVILVSTVVSANRNSDHTYKRSTPSCNKPELSLNKKVPITKHTTLKRLASIQKYLWRDSHKQIHSWERSLCCLNMDWMILRVSCMYYKSRDMNIHIHVHLDKRPEWVKGARDSVNLTECTLILLFIFIPLDYLLHYIEELCEAGFSVITVSVFVYQTNTMSANNLLMYAVPLTFREEAREDTSTHNPPRARGSLPFFFFSFSDT